MSSTYRPAKAEITALPNLEALSPAKHRWKKPNDVVVFSCLRNERTRLPHFVEYHRNLGVSGFVFIDNASTDTSREWIRAQDDCTLLFTCQSYAASGCGISWLNEALGRLAANRWVLILDLDELLFYPRIETLRLAALVDYIDQHGWSALPTFMLDMYNQGLLGDVSNTLGATFLENCPYYDSEGYHVNNTGVYKGIPTRGGPRQRLFWSENQQHGNPPVLGKCPLIRWDSDCQLRASTHNIEGVIPADITGAILHFKFLDDFFAKVREEVDRKEHWDDAAQYRAYLSGIEQNRKLSLAYHGTKKLENSQDLIEQGLMLCPEHFIDWARLQETEPSASSGL